MVLRSQFEPKIIVSEFFIPTILAHIQIEDIKYSQRQANQSNIKKLSINIRVGNILEKIVFHKKSVQKWVWNISLGEISLIKIKIKSCWW